MVWVDGLKPISIGKPGAPYAKTKNDVQKSVGFDLHMNQGKQTQGHFREHGYLGHGNLRKQELLIIP